MGYSQDHSIHSLNITHGAELYTVQCARLVCICDRISNERLNAVFAQFFHDVEHLAIARIRTILLEREAQNGDSRTFDLLLRLDQILHAILGNVFSHVVVNPAAGQNNLAMVTHHFRLIGQIVRINANAMPSYEAGVELQEIPLRPRRLQHGLGIDTHLIEDDGKLIHKGDVDVSLAILNDLGSFGDLDAGSPVYARLDDQLIHMGNFLQGLRVHPGDNFGNGLQSVYLIAGVDALRRIAHFEVHATFESGFTL